MLSTNRNSSNSDINPEITEEMSKYGITRVPVDYFHYKEFRYTNLKDAVKQAQRQQHAGEPRSPAEPIMWSEGEPADEAGAARK